MEYLRECYESAWHLFADAPDVLTRGYYYFVEDDTPFFPGFHLFGAKIWYDKNWENVQGLGEDIATERVFVDGEFDADRPEPRLVGDADCMLHGEKIANAAPKCSLINGYPPQCYVPLRPVNPPAAPPDVWDQITAYKRCQTQRFWTRVIDWLYAGSHKAIEDLVREAVGPGPVITCRFEQDLQPATVTIVDPNWAIVVMDGTRNFTQLALQAVESLAGPTNFGSYASLPLWRAAATYAHGLLVADGVLDTRKVFITGHSYGGAAAVNLAVRYRLGSAAREIKWLTFGCPRCGDARMVEILNTTFGQALRNDNDAVTIIPLDLTSGAALLPFFPGPRLAGLFNWNIPPKTATQDDDGVIRAGYNSSLSTDYVKNILERIVDGAPLGETFPGHRITEYERRIWLRCPDPAWPVCHDEYEAMDEWVRVDVGGAGRPVVEIAAGGVLIDGTGGSVKELAAGGVLVDGTAAATAFVMETTGGFTWTAPAGVTNVWAWMHGAGGPGGPAQATIDDGYGGGGGGGAWCVAKMAVTPGTDYTGNVGAGDGSDGDSWFAADDRTITAGGGAAGMAGASDGTGGDGGAGGLVSVSAGMTNFGHSQGGAGEKGDDVGSGAYGGGGGGGAGGLSGDGDSASGSSGGTGKPDGGTGGQGEDFPGDATAGDHPGGGGGGGQLLTVGTKPGGDGRVILYVLGLGETGSGLLLEDGTSLLLEDGTTFILEDVPAADGILLEDGTSLLLEDFTEFILEDVPAADGILLEDGTSLLLEDGTEFLLE